jgi:nickel-dependent lactate racemase
MPTVELPFRPGLTAQVEIDQRNLLYYAAQPRDLPVPAQSTVAEKALQHPIGAPPLTELLRPDRRVVIIVDDITRPTPAARVLPPILERIERAGIPDDAVTFFMALGTHRPMTDTELGQKLGHDVLRRFRIVNREYLAGDFVDLGRTESGTPIEMDREVLAADVKIAIGNIVPHIAAGWGGGSKIILPGVCSQNTTDRMHFLACTRQSVLDVVGRRDNQARAEMDAIADHIGLDTIVNTVLDDAGHILGVFAGHHVQAHRAAIRLAEKVMVISIPALADIVVASATPCHVDFWQAIKPYTFAHLGVREGGVIVFLLDGEERLYGDAPSHAEAMDRYLLSSFEDQVCAVDRGAIKDIAGMNVPMHHAMVRSRVQRTICVSNHLTPEDIAALGFEPAPDAQSALARAIELVGQDATVGVIPYGGETLVRVASRA